jgi:hypothetical protein
MDAHDPRRADPDLAGRPRLGQVGDGLRIELQRQRSTGVVRGPLGGGDGGEQRRQHAVGVERLDRADRGAQDLDQFRLAGRAAVDAPRGESGLEQQDQPGDDVGMGGEGLLDVALPERQPGLAQPLHVGPDDRDLSPVETGQQNEGAEPVVLGLALPDGGDGVGEPLRE